LSKSPLLFVVGNKGDFFVHLLPVYQLLLPVYQPYRHGRRSFAIVFNE